MKLKAPYILKLIMVCAGIKARVVEEDEKETKGIRTILNFGHTLAHALETALKYQKLSHGEAVAIGMLYAARLSLYYGLCSEEEVQEIHQILTLFSLPTRINAPYSTLTQALTYDKKFISGKVRMVLVKQIGKVEVFEGINLKDIKATLQDFLL